MNMRISRAAAVGAPAQVDLVKELQTKINDFYAASKTLRAQVGKNTPAQNKSAFDRAEKLAEAIPNLAGEFKKSNARAAAALDFGVDGKKMNAHQAVLAVDKELQSLRLVPSGTLQERVLTPLRAYKKAVDAYFNYDQQVYNPATPAKSDKESAALLDKLKTAYATLSKVLGNSTTKSLSSNYPEFAGLKNPDEVVSSRRYFGRLRPSTN